MDFTKPGRKNKNTIVTLKIRLSDTTKEELEATLHNLQLLSTTLREHTIVNIGMCPSCNAQLLLNSLIYVVMEYLMYMQKLSDKPLKNRWRLQRLPKKSM